MVTALDIIAASLADMGDLDPNTLPGAPDILPASWDWQRVEAARTLGQRLALARQLAGLSLGQTARLLQRAPGYIREIEDDIRAPCRAIVTRWADLCAVSERWLRTGELADVPVPPGTPEVAALIVRMG